MKSKNVIKKESQNKKSSPSTGSYTNDSHDKYLIPVSSEIRIIDFGGATYENETHTEIINTRQYRAPEVILGKINKKIKDAVNGTRNQTYGHQLVS